MRDNAVGSVLISNRDGLWGIVTRADLASADAELARARYAAASLDELSQGRALYVTRCAGCHALKSPGSLAPQEWRGEVRAMRQERGVALADAEGEAIVRYLEAVSLQSAR